MVLIDFNDHCAQKKFRAYEYLLFLTEVFNLFVVIDAAVYLVQYFNLCLLALNLKLLYQLIFKIHLSFVFFNLV